MKEKALKQIRDIALMENLEAKEVYDYLKKANIKSPDKIEVRGEKAPTSSIIQVLSILGALFLFAGMAVATSMHWDGFDSLSRVLVTFGVGLVFHLVGFYLSTRIWDRACASLWFIGYVLQVGGLFVFFQEYFVSTGNPERAAVLIFMVMLIQQGMALKIAPTITFLFTSMLSVTGLLVSGFEITDIPTELNGTLTAVVLMSLTYWLKHTSLKAGAPFWFFTSSVMLYVSAFLLIEDTPFELAFIPLGFMIMWLAAHLDSKTLLFTSAFALFAFVVQYSSEYFASSIGWPITLMFIGLCMLGLSFLTFYITHRYMVNEHEA